MLLLLLLIGDHTFWKKRKSDRRDQSLQLATRVFDILPRKKVCGADVKSERRGDLLRKTRIPEEYNSKETSKVRFCHYSQHFMGVLSLPEPSRRIMEHNKI
ncbi:hypothetical protein J4Q44_G00078690 [Coregonus suidteri]|uniref:Uncharacterized protein n=1 Tax=Coregonus suidteri TaxID=861788 RepID=A0AAN8LY00_9TELE